MLFPNCWLKFYYFLGRYLCTRFALAMTKCILSLHPESLDPFQAAKAWFLRTKSELEWSEVRRQVRTVSGKAPGQRSMENAVRRVAARKQGCPELKYANCGRTSILTAEQKRSVCAFVRKWRAKRFRTSKRIIKELKLKCGVRTARGTLNAACFFWRAVPRKTKLTKEQIQQREAFVKTYVGKSAQWLAHSIGLVMDGITLTCAPK